MPFYLKDNTLLTRLSPIGPHQPLCYTRSFKHSKISVGVPRLKRSAILFLLFAVITWTACGGGSGSSNKAKQLSNVKERVFVTNFVGSTVQIVDAAKDELTA